MTEAESCRRRSGILRVTHSPRFVNNIKQVSTWLPALNCPKAARRTRAPSKAVSFNLPIGFKLGNENNCEYQKLHKISEWIVNLLFLSCQTETENTYLIFLLSVSVKIIVKKYEWVFLGAAISIIFSWARFIIGPLFHQAEILDWYTQKVRNTYFYLFFWTDNYIVWTWMTWSIINME